MKKFLMFHGLECPHCARMMPVIERLVKETGVEVEKLEVWHNEKNADLMRQYQPVIAPKCGGQLRTPTFFEPGTGDGPLRRGRIRKAQGLGGEIGG